MYYRKFSVWFCYSLFKFLLGLEKKTFYFIQKFFMLKIKKYHCIGFLFKILVLSFVILIIFKYTSCFIIFIIVIFEICWSQNSCLAALKQKVVSLFLLLFTCLRTLSPLLLLFNCKILTLQSLNWKFCCYVLWSFIICF